jgi:hypothetical protein
MIGRPTRLYFPATDLGQKVTVKEIWFGIDSNGDGRPDDATATLLPDQEFQVDGIERVVGVSLAFIDITGKVPAQAVFSYANGYAVRGVKGASMKVRALWNPGYFSFTNDPIENYRRVEVWARGWRKTETESFLAGGQN